MSRPNWSRPLPQPLAIPDLMQLKTLADVQTLIEKHLPAGQREKSTWRVVAKDLKAAAKALMLEGVECRPSDAAPLPAALVCSRKPTPKVERQCLIVLDANGRALVYFENETAPAVTEATSFGFSPKTTPVCGFT